MAPLNYPDDPAFYWMHLDENNVDDLLNDLNKEVWVPPFNLVGIVSRDGGGIIAYALGEEHAMLIVKALMATKPLTPLLRAYLFDKPINEKE